MQMECKNETRLMNIKQLCDYTSLGRKKADEFAISARARVRYGKHILYDRFKIDTYIENIGGREGVYR